MQGACAVQLEFELWGVAVGLQAAAVDSSGVLAFNLAAAVLADGARPRGVGISSIWRGVVVVEDMGHGA